jgi:hypothetical protein
VTVLAFVAGLFVGTNVGVLVAALCAAAAHGDRQSPR